MRPILLIYERVKNNESSVENAENKYLGITQKEREESALAYLQNEKNQHLLYSNSDDYKKEQNENQETYKFLKERKVHERFTNNGLLNNFKKEYDTSLQSYESKNANPTFFEKQAEKTESILYCALQNTGAWCWANSSFQILASLTAVKNITVPQNLPDGFTSFQNLIDFLKTLGKKNETKTKLPNMDVQQCAQLLTNDMKYHTQYLNNLYIVNEKKNMYQSFEKQQKLFLMKKDEETEKETNEETEKVTSVDQHDPGELFVIFYQLFEVYDIKHPEYYQLDNNIFGFKSRLENYCLNNSNNTRQVYALSPNPKNTDTNTQQVDFIYETFLKYKFDTIPNNDITKILDYKDSSFTSYKFDEDGSICSLYEKDDKSLNHISMHTKIIPEKNKIIHIQILREYTIKINKSTIQNKVNSTDIIFPEQISVIKEGDLNETTYVLKGITYHTGSQNSGHHIALCKRDNDWFYFSDTYCYKFTNGFNDVKTYASNGCQHLFYECD